VQDRALYVKVVSYGQLDNF